MAGLTGLDAGRVRLWLFARCVQESVEDPNLQAVAARLAP
jgi:streptomycin 6-kinase